MIKVFHKISGALGVNCWFLTVDGKNALLIDCGDDYALIKAAEKEFGFKVRAVLLTHAHFDHSGVAKRLQDDGVDIYISKKDAPKLSNTDNLADHFGIHFQELTPNFTFSGGDSLNILGVELQVISTAGHTDGSVTFLVEDMLFTGDTLFNQSFGRCDFPTGNLGDLIASCKKLFALQGDYKICAGHGDISSLSHERKFNPINCYDRY